MINPFNPLAAALRVGAGVTTTVLLLDDDDDDDDDDVVSVINTGAGTALTVIKVSTTDWKVPSAKGCGRQREKRRTWIYVRKVSKMSSIDETSAFFPFLASHLCLGETKKKKKKQLI